MSNILLSLNEKVSILRRLSEHAKRFQTEPIALEIDGSRYVIDKTGTIYSGWIPDWDELYKLERQAYRSARDEKDPKTTDRLVKEWNDYWKSGRFHKMEINILGNVKVMDIRDD